MAYLQIVQRPRVAIGGESSSTSFSYSLPSTSAASAAASLGCDFFGIFWDFMSRKRFGPISFLLETHHFVLRNVEDLLLDDLGLVLGQEVQDGFPVCRGLDERVLKYSDEPNL